jgi:hypothetical protein
LRPDSIGLKSYPFAPSDAMKAEYPLYDGCSLYWKSVGPDFPRPVIRAVRRITLSGLSEAAKFLFSSKNHKIF